ncbi:Zn(2)-C6 fungal-type domain-containing protein [Mycena indigotica]|uniref:Zn(2)-C6 fungal-type domain-containing protein n=1 Tax=Mycena indigotica TaxID=2126181 RepID=A0A8H6SM51_9AGAR|nr:Zn(2)-C6 fungal-type domain-containing protein [Mycena indigotica]KAF7301357.1 Zn(2)-C6 fungal-type domain-containing protein [Mycena indigotica]
MPVDSSRRSSRKLNNDDETDVRRARGELSCAECRRLKLKCDKKLPCSSCSKHYDFFIVSSSNCSVQFVEAALQYVQMVRQRRSLSSQGKHENYCASMTPVFKLCSSLCQASTDHLHTKIGEMGQRIRQLEDALAIFQSSTGSNETHPLLRDELLSIKFGPEKGTATDKQPKPRETATTEPIDALGTLTIGDDGEGRYFGPSAGSETLFLAGAQLEMASNTEDDDFPPLSLEIARLSNSFPFSAGGPPGRALDLLFDYLPDQPRAWTLCETYMEQCAWQFRPISREEMIDDFLTPIYKSARDRKNWQSETEFPHAISPHRLAVLFLTFALGALVDLTLEPHNIESDQFYHASRAALALRSIFDSPEMATVQAVLLMASYHNMGGRRYTMESSWSLMCLGSKLAQSVCSFPLELHIDLIRPLVGSSYVNLSLSDLPSLLLDRDSARWNMDPKIVNRRRSLFWETFSSEQFQSIALGRPPSIRLSYVDCEFPAPETTLDENGNPQVDYYEWKYSFTRDVFALITERTLTAETPSYETVLELDRLVRAKTLPPYLNVFLTRDDQNCTPSTYMRGCLLGQFRSVALLYIHRTFFAQAMLDHPVNPLRSPYAPSFLAAYRCASGMIKANLNHFERRVISGIHCPPSNKCPDSPSFVVGGGSFGHISTSLLCSGKHRDLHWSYFTQLEQIIVGCIVTRSPSSSMAPTAFIELGLACDLFEKGAKQSRRARSGLAILCKLREKAYQVYSQFRSGNPTPPPNGFGRGLHDYGEDELALFGGQTRVLVSRLISKRHKKDDQPTTPSISGTNSNASSPGSSGSSASDSMPDVHPSLVDYLSLFPPSQQPTELPNLAQPELPLPPMLPPPVYASNEAQVDPATFEFYGYDQTYYGTAMGIPATQSAPYFPNVEPAPKDMSDLGLLLSGDSGIDEQWKSFMKKSFSGLLDEHMDVQPTQHANY